MAFRVVPSTLILSIELQHITLYKSTLKESDPKEHPRSSMDKKP